MIIGMNYLASVFDCATRRIPTSPKLRLEEVDGGANDNQAGPLPCDQPVDFPAGTGVPAFGRSFGQHNSER